MISIIDETNKLRLENNFERVELVEKDTGKVLFKDDFYGDPSCGIIENNNKWAVVAGHHLTVWTPVETRIIKDKEISWIHSIRYKNSQTFEILIDPWAKNSSVWEVCIFSFQLKKLKDFDSYKNQKYTENVVW